MGKDDYGPISQYNSLTDPNLQGYYSKSTIRSHLKHTGLINRKGEIIPEDVWRKKAITKEKMEQASRLIASKIVQQAIEIKNLERAEIRRKLEEVAKKELVRRIRGQSVQNRQLPLLWSNKQTSDDRPRSGLRGRDSRSDEEFGDIRLVDDHDDNHRTFASKPKLRPLKKSTSKRRRLQRTFSAYPRAAMPPQTILTMIYYGKSVKIPYDYEIFESKDEISIYQQHCGGENLLVYNGLHESGDKFSFRSRRHKEYPFSLTIYVNGTYDCRISTCCEYRHKLNVRIGGKTGRFGFTNVVGDHPCVKCLLEKSTEEKKRQQILQKLENEENFDDFKPITDSKHKVVDKDGDKNNEIPVNHGGDDYGSDFDEPYNSEFSDSEVLKKDYRWTVVVHTESKNVNNSANDKDSSVSLKIIGEKGSSEVFTLDNMTQDNFNSDRNEKFNVLTDNNIGMPTHIVLNFKDKNSYDWVVNKIELIDEENSRVYTFTFNDRIKKNHDIKIALDEDKYTQKKWLVKVYTSDLPDTDYEGTDSKVYITLIGENNYETDRVWLTKKLSKTRNKTLFDRGAVDEFLINTNLNVDKLEKIRVGHDSSGRCNKWHLQKIEIIDQKTWAHYFFNCERWLAKDEDDGKTERLLNVWEGESFARSSKLEIKVRHLDDPDSDAEIPNQFIKGEKQDVIVHSTSKGTSKMSVSSQISHTSSKKKMTSEEKTEVIVVKNSRPESKVSKSSRNEFDSKSLRLSTNDLINEMNKQKDAQISGRSTASSSSAESSLLNSDEKRNLTIRSEKSTSIKSTKTFDSDNKSNKSSKSNKSDKSIKSKSSTGKRTSSRQSKMSSANVVEVKQEKTRRLSGPEVEKIINNEISNSARSSAQEPKIEHLDPDQKSDSDDSDTTVSSSSSDDANVSVSDDTDTELSSDSDDTNANESFSEILNKEAINTNKDTKPNDDQPKTDAVSSPDKIKETASNSSSRVELKKNASQETLTEKKNESLLRPGSRQSNNSRLSTNSKVSNNSKPSNRADSKSSNISKSNKSIQKLKESPQINKTPVFDSDHDSDASSLFDSKSKDKNSQISTPKSSKQNDSLNKSEQSLKKLINDNDKSSERTKTPSLTNVQQSEEILMKKSPTPPLKSKPSPSPVEKQQQYRPPSALSQSRKTPSLDENNLKPKFNIPQVNITGVSDQEESQSQSSRSSRKSNSKREEVKAEVKLSEKKEDVKNGEKEQKKSESSGEEDIKEWYKEEDLKNF